MSIVIPFQPTLPVEVKFTEAEIAYLDDSPPGLYPENQDSNYGLLRKTYTDRIQELIDQLALMYNERFVRTSSTFIDVWEQEVGLPVNPQGKTLDQRRVAVLGRIAKGPFTHARRASVIEGFIVATFGGPIQFFPEGVVLSSSGTPIYAEFADVSTLYSIRENGPQGRNLLTNGNFENNTNSWSNDGSVTGMAISTSQSKWGTHSLAGTAAGANPYMYYATGAAVTAGNWYTAFGWIYCSRAVSLSMQVQWTDGSYTVLKTSTRYFNYPTPNTWMFVWVRGQAPAGVTYARPVFQAGGAQAGDTFAIDGAQLEPYQIPSGKNKFPNSGIEGSDLADWFYTGTAPTQSTGQVHSGSYALYVPLSAASQYVAKGSIIYNGWQPIAMAGTVWTASAWVYGTAGQILRIQINEAGGATTETGVVSQDYTLVNGWQRISCVGTVVQPDRTTLNVYFLALSGAMNIYLDDIQLEQGPMTAYAESVPDPDFVNPERTPFYYEVRIKNSVSPDMVGLVRELTRITPAGITFDVYQTPTI